MSIGQPRGVSASGVGVWLGFGVVAATATAIAFSLVPEETPVVADLAEIAISDEDTRVPYVRDAFGPSWEDVDHNGCDTRNDILARDLTSPVIDSDGCRVLAGVLADDPYTGERVEFTRGEQTSAEVPVDHVVPLAEAWRSGARHWTAEDRAEFANDPLNLLATTRAVNSAKSDLSPDQWLPAEQARACDYVVRYVAVKVKYELAVDPDEHEALAWTLDGCPDTPRTPRN